jgi:hypothetical protein
VLDVRDADDDAHADPGLPTWWDGLCGVVAFDAVFDLELGAGLSG